MADESRNRNRASPIIKAGYRKGMAPPNKGKKTPAEVLTQDELNRLMDQMKGTGKVGPRNRAMVALMYRAGMKVGQVVALQRWHYAPDGHTITVPGRQEREIPIDSVTQKLLMDWIAVRRKLKNLPRLAPLFCGVSEPAPGGPVNSAYIRELLREMGDRAGIDKRVNPSGLRKTYEERKAERSSRIVAHLAAHLDETTFASRYPVAYEKWRDAFDLYELGPERHATRVGHDCREAIVAFANDLIRLHNVEDVDPTSGTQIKVRAVFAAQPDMSKTVREYADKLVAFWRSVSDLAQRQEHAALRDVQGLTADDARRLVFQSLVVMAEIDSALHAASRWAPRRRR